MIYVRAVHVIPKKNSGLVADMLEIFQHIWLVGTVKYLELSICIPKTMKKSQICIYGVVGGSKKSKKVLT